MEGEKILLQLARTLVFMEMLFINLITTHRCSRTRYSQKSITAGLIFYTALVMLTSFLIKRNLRLEFLNGSIIILLGFTYFFPLKYLYDESSGKILAIMFFSWIHTMAVTSISIQISMLFELDNYFYLALILQTIIYLVSTRAVIRFVKNKFIPILKNIPKEMNKHLIVLSLMEFTSVTIVYLFFNENANPYWTIIIVALIASIAAINYHLIYVVVKNYKSISFLKLLAYSDTLTGIKNRLALFLDCDKLISQNKPFTYIYMDLDDFKKVNDTYGHSVGDDYLKQFTKAAIETIGDKGSIYRMSGDEFVCIYNEDKIDLLLATFDEKVMNLFEMSVPFLGVSIGYAKFPEDADSLDKLVNKADKIMYKVKKTNKLKPI
jgi:diguanylate cyclase (GGDEF)-like protein